MMCYIRMLYQFLLLVIYDKKCPQQHLHSQDLMTNRNHQLYNQDYFFYLSGIVHTSFTINPVVSKKDPSF